ncbi:hypothetical protein M422DRAFT_148865 [Sphaerobolus stellatus SS14]|nr:hypothetical protein M422DRAFT_148865 [Sphaerobolus stellatus SS14]
MLGKKKWDPKGKHCYVTGGSSGTGLALALLLTKKGSHVSIVARDEVKLSKALEQMETVRQNPEQILKSYSFSLNTLETSKAALDAACAPHSGQAPDAVFTCAGTAKPGYWIEETEEQLLNGMSNAYWIQAFTALAATQKMVRDGVQGRLAFVSSILGLMSFVGYSTYAPGKHALKGLAETLRSELVLYGISVHIFFPSTIYSPGYEEENKTKPTVTKKIEEADSGLQPEQVAEGILEGVSKGYSRHAVDFSTRLFLSANRGNSPSSNTLFDMALNAISWIGIPIWRRSVDSEVRKHRDEHMRYLQKQGLNN